MPHVSNREMREYLRILLRIDDKSAQLRRALTDSAIDAVFSAESTDNEINRLYIELGELINESLRARRRWRSRRNHREDQQGDESSAGTDTTPPLPSHIGDVKQLMGMGEHLGMNLIRLIDTAQYAKAQAECLKMCRAIDIYVRGRK